MADTTADTIRPSMGEIDMASRIHAVFTIAFLVLFTPAVWAVGDDHACTVTEDDQLVSPEAEVQQFAGWRLAVDDDTLAVSVFRGLDPNAVDRVDMYDNTDGRWQLSQTVVPSDSTFVVNFADCVSLDGDTLVVGARDDGTFGQNAGAAYVFHREGGQWVEQQKLFASDAAAAAKFGDACDVDGDVLIIGTAFTLPDGAAYIFRYNGAEWVEEQKLTFPEGPYSGAFGWSVSIQGDVAAVSALNLVYEGGWIVADAGAVHIYRFDGAQWNHEAMFSQGNGKTYSGGGWVVDLDGDRLAVSAPYASIGPDWAGAVYLYEWTGREWQPHSTVWGTPPIGGFGWSMDLCGDRLLVGDIGDSAAAKNAGAAFLWTVDNGQWVMNAGLYPEVGQPTMQFSEDVALAESHALVGVPIANIDGEQAAGAVYVYTLPACPDAPDTPADLNADGAVDGADLGLLLSAWGEGESSADLNGDTTVDGADLGLLLAAWSSGSE